MRKSNSQKGFLMVEISLATIFVSTALLAVMALLIQNIVNTRQADINTNAPYLAQHKLEQLKAGLIGDSGSENFAVNGVTYTLEWNKTLEQSNGSVNLHKATVTVNWNERSGNTQLNFVTYLVDGIAQSPQW